jgi:hypothetical protein
MLRLWISAVFAVVYLSLWQNGWTQDGLAGALMEEAG